MLLKREIKIVFIVFALLGQINTYTEGEMT